MYNKSCSKYLFIITIKTQKRQKLTVSIALLVVLKKEGYLKDEKTITKEQSACERLNSV